MRSASSVSACLLLLLPLLAIAVPSLTPIQEPSVAHQEDEEGPLAHEMEDLKKHMRVLRKSLGDPARLAESVEHAQAMFQNSLEAMTHCPEAPSSLSQVEQVQWRVDFQRKMLAVCDHLLQMELALAEKRFEDAKVLYRALSDIKKEGHDTYDPEEE